MVENPFTPQPGTPPRVLVGSGERAARLFAEELGSLAQRCARGHFVPAVVSGSRWCGKRAAVAVLRERAGAERHTFAECSGAEQGPLVERLAAAVGTPFARSFVARDAEERGRQADGPELWQGGPRGGRALGQLLLAVAGEHLEHEGAGLVVVVGEPELAEETDRQVLGQALSLLAAEPELPPLEVVLVSTQEPSAVQDLLGLRCAVTQHRLAPLGESDVARLLVATAAEREVRFDPDAAAELATWSGPLPVMAQLVGSEAWDAARPEWGGEITAADAHAGRERAAARLREEILPLMWQETSADERAYLRVLCDQTADGAAVPVATVRAPFQDGFAWAALEGSLERRSLIVTEYGEATAGEGGSAGAQVLVRPALPGLAELVAAHPREEA